jgi:hypothetical protein
MTDGSLNTAHLTNVAIGQQRTAKIGQAYFFDGTSSFVSIPDSSAFHNSSTGLTLAMWINVPAGKLPSNLGHPMTLIDKEDGTSGWGLVIGTDNKPVFTVYYANMKIIATSSQAITAGTWTFVAATYAPYADTYVYVGQSANSSDLTTLPYPENALAIGIGSSAHSRNDYALGYIDEVGIWQRALSAAQLTALWRRQLDLDGAL